MKFIRIISSDSKYFNKVSGLYQYTFPDTERHTSENFEKLANSQNKYFYCNAVVANDEFIGFINYWNFEKFIFIEHFAIETAFQGCGYGRNVLSKLTAEISKPVILEVEPPLNELNIRRINFYTGSNLNIIPRDYQQPSYQSDGMFYPMLLMSDDLEFAKSHFGHVKATIYKEVYLK